MFVCPAADTCPQLGVMVLSRSGWRVATLQCLTLMLAVACDIDGAKAAPAEAEGDAALASLAMVGPNEPLVARTDTGSRTSANASSCDAKNFSGVTQLERDCFETNAGLRGNVTWTGDNESGTFTYKRGGVRVKTGYSYSSTSLDFTLTVLAKPWLASCKMLYRRYSGGLTDCDS